MIVLAVMLILLSIAVNAIFIAQSNRNLDALLAGQAQLARQLARSGAGPQQIVNRVQAGGVQAYLVLRNGTEFGTPITSGAAIKTTTITLNAPTRVDGASLYARRRRVACLRSTAHAAPSTDDHCSDRIGSQCLCWSQQQSERLRPLDSMAALAKTSARATVAIGWRRPARTPNSARLQAFDEMLDELEGAEKRAQQAEERTRAFLADAAHELRTPIAGVQAAAETLLHHDDQLIMMSASTCRHCWCERLSGPAPSSRTC